MAQPGGRSRARTAAASWSPGPAAASASRPPRPSPRRRRGRAGRAQPRQGPGRGRADAGRRGGRGCSTWPTWRRCGPSPTRSGAGGRAGQQRGVLGAAVRPLAGRGRAAPRHQPPRPLRPDQPAAAAAHRPGGGRRLGLAPARRARPRRPRLGAARRKARSRRTPHSKLANLLFLAELQRRLTAAGSTLRVAGAHPGPTSTTSPAGPAAGSRPWSASTGTELVGMPAVAGRAADVVRRDDGRARQHLHRAAPAARDDRLAAPVGRSHEALDPDLAKALWAESERLSGVTFPL